MPDSPPTVPAILRRQARTRADHPLLVCDDDRISYSATETLSAQLARGLIALGAGKGTHIGVLYPNGIQFVVAALAAARIGAVVVPFATFSTSGELREQLLDSDVRILLAAASYRSHDYTRRLTEIIPDLDYTPSLFNTEVPQLREVAISYPPDNRARIRDIERVYRLGDTVDEALLAAVENDVDCSDPLAIIYTSGTTDSPKGVVHTHGALLSHQDNLNRIRGLTAADKLFCNSPFCWIGGFAFALLATLVAGSTLVCSNAVDAGDTLDLLESERPTFTNGFAAGVTHLTRHPSFANRDLSSMRQGNLYPIMAPEARPTDPELRHNMLGLTEAGGVVLISGDEADQPENRRGSFGRPAPGFEVQILDTATQQPVHNGRVGELCIRGPHVMQRYHKRSREECFDADGWFHTGDLVAVDADGFFYFIARRGAMIKSAGANVSPAEVEKAIAKVTGGMVAHVVGLPDAERKQIVAAIVVLENGTMVDEAALREQLKAELSSYKIPRRFAAVAVGDVPLLASGKVDIAEMAKVFDAN